MKYTFFFMKKYKNIIEQVHILYPNDPLPAPT